MKSTMKILLAVFAFLLYIQTAIAQVPQMFNYQGVARDAKGNPLSNQKMSLKLSVLPAADATAPEYEETQMVNTNEFGLYTLQIGNGTTVTGEMKTVKWETGNKYIKVAIDPAGGTNYIDAGTSQLLSVPYAIYADKAGTAANGGHDKTRTGAVGSNAAHIAGDVNYIIKFTALNTIGKSLVYDNGTNLGVGTTAPVAKIHISQNAAAVQDHLRMQNLSPTGAGRFTLYNDAPSAGYANFTKYGTAYPGGYTGIATMYPYANLLAFGNNGIVNGDGLGRFLLSSSGNIGLSIYKNGLSKLKFHADFASENVGIGGNAIPVSRVHLNNTDGTSIDLRLTNNTTGHTANDGLAIRENGNTASIINKENSTLDLGTNNLSRMTIDSIGNIGIGTNAPNSSYKLTVQPDSANYIGGIKINDPGDQYSFYLQKSGFADAAYLSKTNTGTFSPTLAVLSASHEGYAAEISSTGTGLLCVGVEGAAIIASSIHSIAIEAYADSMPAGYFHSSGYSSTANLLTNGVLKGHFSGTGNNDVAGVYGVSQPNINYGYGVRGLGNYTGIRGDGNTGGFAGIWGHANGAQYAGYFSGNVNITGSIAKGSGTFKIDHPLDPENKYLYHSFVESPDMMNIYNGNIITDANGNATVTMPDYFEALNKEFRYQLTTIGSFAQAMISEEISGNTFKISTSQPNVKISWQVTGIRHDKYADQNRVVTEVEKETQFKGKYIHPTAWGQPESKGIDYSLDNRNGQTNNSKGSHNIIPTNIKAMKERADAERKNINPVKEK